MLFLFLKLVQSGALTAYGTNRVTYAEPGKDCLVEHMDIDGNVCICIDWRSEYEWVKSCYYNKILRWAYIKDLLP